MRRKLLVFAMTLGFVAAMTHYAEASHRRKLFRGKARQAVKASLRAVDAILPPWRKARGGDGACLRCRK